MGRSARGGRVDRGRRWRCLAPATASSRPSRGRVCVRFSVALFQPFFIWRAFVCCVWQCLFRWCNAAGLACWLEQGVVERVWVNSRRICPGRPRLCGAPCAVSGAPLFTHRVGGDLTAAFFVSWFGGGTSKSKVDAYDEQYVSSYGVQIPEISHSSTRSASGSLWCLVCR